MGCWVATFWEMAARSVGHVFSLSFFLFVFLFIFHFGFKSEIWLLIAPVPVYCFSITFFLQRIAYNFVTSSLERSYGSLVRPLFSQCIVISLHSHTCSGSGQLKSQHTYHIIGASSEDSGYMQST